MKHGRVVVDEVDRHLVPACALHASGAWVRYFEIVELLWVEARSSRRVSLRHASVLLSQSLLVLLLLKLLLGSLIYQGRGLRLAGVLLLSLRPLLYCC